MTSTLTDRYVWAVQRSLPEAKRADIDQELRGSIADAVDAKLEAGAAPAAAEREAILELGDPYRLAAGFADLPLHLIGPAVFPDYIRLLKVLYVIVLPIAYAGVLLGQLLGKPESLGSAFGTSIAVIITVAVHFGFWPTLVFALIERSPQYRPTAWNPDTLPQLPSPGTVKLSELVGSLVWFVFTIAVLIWAQFISLFRDAAGAVVPVFDQDLWQFWIPYFLGLAVLQLAFQFVLYQARRWTIALATLNLLIAAAVVAPLVWLITTSQWMNPAFLDRAEIAPLFEPGGVVTIVLVIVFPIMAIAASVDGFVKAIRQERSPA